MNKSYKVPLAALALAGATGCATPVISDWSLMQILVEGEDAPLEESYTDEEGLPRTRSTAASMLIDDDMDAALEVAKSRSVVYGNGRKEEWSSELYFIGEVIPGSGEADYVIDLDGYHDFDCTLQAKADELDCDLMQGDDPDTEEQVWVFKAAAD